MNIVIDIIYFIGLNINGLFKWVKLFSIFGIIGCVLFGFICVLFRNLYKRVINFLGSNDTMLWILIFLISGFFGTWYYYERWQVWSRPVHYGTMQLITLLKVLGIGVTFWAALWSYRQLRKHYNRIDSYEKFFEYAELLFKEIREQDGPTRYFHYYGPTIIPGNIACDDINLVNQYKDDLEKLFKEKKGNERYAIVPRQKYYSNTYDPIKKHELAIDYPKPYSWESYVDKRRDEAIKFQGDLINYVTEDSRGGILGVDDKKIHDIENSYFLSNGVRVIYAIPLHYTIGINSGGEKKRTPHLVGFTSRERRDINAFKERFSEMRRGLEQEWLLKFFYSRHLINPQYLQRYISINGLPQNDDAFVQLADHDHDHFCKRESTDYCLSSIDIDQNSVVLDIGSGLGGPARYISKTKKCTVWGIEIQEDRFDYAEELTERLGLSDKVQFVKGDANIILFDDISNKITERKYTHIISFLSILHMVQKKDILQRLGSLLQNSGKVYIEDFCEGSYPVEDSDLIKSVSSPGLLSEKKYRKALEVGGIEVDKFEVENITEIWTKLAKERCDYLRNIKRKPSKSHFGTDFKTISQALCLYENIYELFKNNAICGIRIIGKKKSNADSSEGA